MLNKAHVMKVLVEDGENAIHKETIMNVLIKDAKDEVDNTLVITNI